MALFKIFKGVKPQLPVERREGYAYITEDQNEFYVDVSNEKRIRIGDVIQVSTEVRLALVTPLDKLYLDTDELEFYKYINGEWKKIGLKELPENGQEGQVLVKSVDGAEWKNNDTILEIGSNKPTQLNIEQDLLNGLEGFNIEFIDDIGPISGGADDYARQESVDAIDAKIGTNLDENTKLTIFGKLAKLDSSIGNVEEVLSNL